MKHKLLHYCLCNALALFFIFLSARSLSAQTRLLTGTVKDAGDDRPLSGARITVRGTQKGTVTDEQGMFRLQALPDAVLEISFIGYKSQTVPTGTVMQLTIVLKPDPSRLDAVVVTAIGIEKAQKTLGYAVTEIQGAEFVEARETNIANSLAGKVPGAQVSANAGSVGSSSRVILRGVKAIGNYQNNQPLYVVDGIPIDNSNGDQPGKYGGTDWGDGIQHINPDDIETMSVLRGAAASALYGSRAQNGVILITTKKGLPGRGIGVEFNSNSMWDSPLLLPDVQNEYGHGFRGRSPKTKEEALDAGTRSWGEKMDGQDVLFFDGKLHSLVPQPDNIANFYQVGHSFANTLALTGGNETAAMRLSASHLDNTGMVPNTFLNRTNLMFTGTAVLGERLKIEAKANYIDEISNRTRLVFPNPARSFTYMARSISNDMISNYKLPNGSIVGFTSDTYNPNPYFLVNEHSAPQSVERLITTALLRYQASDDFSIQARVGRDATARHFQNIEGIGTPYNPGGFLYDEHKKAQEINADALLTYSKSVAERSTLTANLGGNFMQSTVERDYIYAYEFILPGFWNIANTKGRSIYYDLQRKRVLSLYGSVQFAHEDWLFVEATARNDWSSTLPTASNSYFYPSVNSSIIVSELVKLPEIFSFFKVRASWAQVGSDTNPYQLAPTYLIDISAQQSRGAITLGQGSGYVIPLSTLRPTRSNTVEFGGDIRLFGGRFGIDFTVYSQNVFDQILPTDVSFSTGFRQAVINAGAMSNSGVEVLISATPVRNELASDFRWDISLNLSRNWNTVTSLSPGLTTLLLEEGLGPASVVATVGQPYGVIQGRGFQRDAAGRIIHDESGYPRLADNYIPLGNVTPQLLGGITNTFTWSNFTIATLVDFRIGGQMFSYSNAVEYESGNHRATLFGREDGIVSEGVTNNGQPNTKVLRAYEYYPAIAQAAEPFIYSASFVKLREVRLSYTLSQSALQSSFAGNILRGLSVSLVVRNLFFLLNNVPGVDPQSSYTTANGQGMEAATYPTARSVGFNLNLKL